jgi:GTP-binding protein LepA
MEIREPICKRGDHAAQAVIGDVMKLCMERRGIFKSQTFVSDAREMLTFEMPLAS